MSNNPLIKSKSSEFDQQENNKLSYWLEKLHIQGEEIRNDNNRREAHANSQNQHKYEQNDKGDDNTQMGKNTHIRNVATKAERDRHVLDDLVRKSNRNIISISSIFPWDIFPNTIDVEESRVTFKFSQFLSSQSHSVEIKDISNVFIESSIFFATLQVVSRTYVQNDIRISNLNKSKALKVKRIIEGLRTFAEHNINTSNYEIDELILKIDEFHNTKKN